MDFCYIIYTIQGERTGFSQRSKAVLNMSNAAYLQNISQIEVLFFVSVPKVAQCCFVVCALWWMDQVSHGQYQSIKKCLDWTKFRSFGLALDNPVY